jgi:hypothetical protein
MQLDARFDSHYTRSDGCWLWHGATRNGYGDFVVAGVPTYAHRYALERKLGRRLQPGEQSCHTCDVKPCVNPDHLFAGSQADNVADMRAKGRGMNPPLHRGEAHHRASLSDAQVASLRADSQAGLSLRALARKYGCWPSTAWRIIHEICRCN